MHGEQSVTGHVSAVGPYRDYLEHEAECERADRRPPPIVAHEQEWELRQLREIAAKHGTPLGVVIEAFYVGRLSAQGGGDA